MTELLDELKRRWLAMFGALAGGDDVPPAQRLRTEGMMEAALVLHVATEVELSAAMDSCYSACFGRAIAEDFGDDWRDFHPFPQIPAMGRRAPVYPSTPD